MRKNRLMAVALAGLLAAAMLPLTIPDAGAGVTSQYSQTKKKKKVQAERRAVKKRNFATPPGEPNQAGMTDDCAYWYNIYGRMPVGCNRHGRSFYSWDFHD
jgi:hypothetical protein